MHCGCLCSLLWRAQLDYLSCMEKITINERPRETTRTYHAEGTPNDPKPNARTNSEAMLCWIGMACVPRQTCTKEKKESSPSIISTNALSFCMQVRMRMRCGATSVIVVPGAEGKATQTTLTRWTSRVDLPPTAWRTARWKVPWFSLASRGARKTRGGTKKMVRGGGGATLEDRSQEANTG